MGFSFLRMFGEYEPPINVPVDEKAKMDYQLHLDRKRQLFGSRFWDMLFDKLIFSLLVVIAGGLGTWGVNTWMEGRRQEEATKLEKFKLDEARRRFFMEKRLDALYLVAGAVSEMTGAFFKYSPKGMESKADVAKAEYAKALESAREIVNRHLPVLGSDFDTNVSRYIQVHRSFSEVGVTTCHQYRKWASDLDDDFTAMCEEYRRSEAIPRQKWMRLKSIDFEERDKMTPQQYLDAQFGYWRATKK